MDSLALLVLKDMITKKLGETSLTRLSALDLGTGWKREEAAIDEASTTLSLEKCAIYDAIGDAYIDLVKGRGGFAELLQNLNAMQAVLKKSKCAQVELPTFHTVSEGTTRLRLCYDGTGAHSSPLIAGIIKALAKQHRVHDLTITTAKCTTLARFSDDILIEWNLPLSGATSSLAPVERARAATLESPRCDARARGGDVVAGTGSNSESLVGWGLNAVQLAVAFPFHVVLNTHLDIVQVGPSLAKIVPDLTAVILKGQIVSTSNSISFLGAPVLRSAQEASALGLSRADFAIHDPSRETLFAPAAPSGLFSPRAREESQQLYAEAKKKVSLFKRLLGQSSASPAATHASASSSSSSPGVSKSVSGPANLQSRHPHALSRAQRSVSLRQLSTASVSASASSATVSASTSASASCPPASSSSPPPLPSPRTLDDKSDKSVSPRANRITADPKTRLRDLLTQDSWRRYPFALRLLHLSAEHDERADMENLFTAFTVMCRQRFAHLLRHAISSEYGSDATDPLREDSVVSRLLALYMRREGRAYLIRHFGVIQQRDAKQSPEVTARSLLESLERGTRAPPSDGSSNLLEVRRALAVVHATASGRRSSPGDNEVDEGAEVARQAIITAFFMRFVSAALVNPSVYNVRLEREERGSTIEAPGALIRVAKQLQTLVCQPPDAEVRALVDNIVRWTTMQTDTTLAAPQDAAEQQAGGDITQELSVVRNAIYRHTAGLWASSGSSAERVHETLREVLRCAL